MKVLNNYRGQNFIVESPSRSIDHSISILIFHRIFPIPFWGPYDLRHSSLAPLRLLTSRFGTSQHLKIQCFSSRFLIEKLRCSMGGFSVSSWGYPQASSTSNEVFFFPQPKRFRLRWGCPSHVPLSQAIVGLHCPRSPVTCLWLASSSSSR